MNTEEVKAPAARPWARRLATLHTRATKRGLREQPSPLAEITEDALAVGVAMLQELAQQHVECERLRTEVRGQVAAWEHLFEVMPTACVITDGAGVIVEANRASRAVLNISPKSLRGRALVVFFEDRSAFNRISQDVRARQAATAARLTVRPRERKPSRVPTVVAPAGTSGGEWMVWFLGGVVESSSGVGDVSAAVESSEESALLHRDPVPLRCEHCGVMTAAHHELVDCVAILQQQVHELRIQIDARGEERVPAPRDS